MAIIFTNTDRRVIPNWKSFTKTAQLGELNSYNTENKSSLFSVASYIQDWKLNKTVPFAADLLSAAVSNDQITSQEVKDAAKFILENKNESTNTQRALASVIIKLEKGKAEQKMDEFNDDTELNDENLFECMLSIEQIYQKINGLKLRIIEYPSNPILYVELSRNYISIGQIEQAVLAINKALFLGKNNRFILRSAARLFIHLKDKEQALYVLKKSELIKNDPWLMASEISISSMLKRNSNNIKKGLAMLESGNFSFASLSELASSIGTVEYINGSFKKSKKLFHTSLIEPNDNSLAQAEWAASKSVIQDVDLLTIHTHAKNSFSESSVLSSYNRKEYAESIRFASNWIEDMPFAMRPVLFASSLSTTYLKNYELSEKILKIGLRANPVDAQLINNIAYACALNNEINKAEGYLAQINSNFVIDKTTEICLLATKGLVDFRKGLHDSGRQLYQRAIEKTNDYKDSPNLKWTAILNYAREELQVNPAARKQIESLISPINDNSLNEDTKVLKNDVMLLIE
jgi:tetratricopeptide (TPR) repeat protein